MSGIPFMLTSLSRAKDRQAWMQKHCGPPVDRDDPQLSGKLTFRAEFFTAAREADLWPPK